MPASGIPLRLKGTERAEDQTPALTAGTKVYALQEMSTSEIYDGIIYLILKEFAKTDPASVKTGELTVADVGGTQVGDFVDTTRDYSIGTKGSVVGGLGKSTTTDTYIYQMMTQIPEGGANTLIRPLCYDASPGSGKSAGLREMTDDEIFYHIIDPALNSMTATGIGSYYVDSGSSPTDSNGNALSGTWASIFTLTDRYKIGNVQNTSVVFYVNNTVQPPTGPSNVWYTVNAASTNTTQTYTVFRKTDNASAPTAPKRPLKWANTANRGKHIVEMTNAEITKMIHRFRNQIIATGKGTYKFQPAMPTSGTWAVAGDGVEDLLNVITTTYYSQTFGIPVTKAYTGYYTSAFNTNYTGTYAGVTGSHWVWYYSWGQWVADTTNFTGTYASTTRTGNFAEIRTANFVRTRSSTFTADTVGSEVLPQTTYKLFVKRLS